MRRFSILLVVSFVLPGALEGSARCRGITATILVDHGVIVGGPLDGRPYRGLIFGTPGDDVIVGTNAGDVIDGRGGRDIICAGNGTDLVAGGVGHDILDGGVGVNIILGGPGQDRCAHGRALIGCSPPPRYPTYHGLMDQVSLLGPLYTTGAAWVPIAALEDAETMLAVMLRHRSDVVTTLQAAGALTSVFGRSETVCDLPYFADLSGPAC